MNEILALQNAVWDVIVVVGVIGGLIVALVLACLFCHREPSNLDHQPSIRFEPGQWVKASREMVWMYGCSVTVPRGAIIQLIDRFDTSDGPRWSAKWKRIHLHSVPEEFIEAYDRATEADTAIVEKRDGEGGAGTVAVSLDGLFVLLGTMGPDDIAMISPRRRLSQAEIAGLSKSLPDNLRGRVVLLEHCDATIRKAVAS